MMSHNLAKDFQIHIIPNIMGSRIRKIKFYDAHLVNLKDNFSATSNEPLSETLTITAAGVEDSTSAGIYTATWRETFPEEESTAVTTIEEDEPNFLGYFFENEEGEEIDQNELKADQKIILVIQTEYVDGETIELNLNDNKLDFKYDGKVAKNDIITGINVTENETRVELITIEQQ